MTKYNKFPSPKKKIIKNIKIFEQPVLKKKFQNTTCQTFLFANSYQKLNQKFTKNM